MDKNEIIKCYQKNPGYLSNINDEGFTQIFKLLNLIDNKHDFQGSRVKLSSECLIKFNEELNKIIIDKKDDILNIKNYSKNEYISKLDKLLSFSHHGIEKKTSSILNRLIKSDSYLRLDFEHEHDLITQCGYGYIIKEKKGKFKCKPNLNKKRAENTVLKTIKEHIHKTTGIQTANIKFCCDVSSIGEWVFDKNIIRSEFDNYDRFNKTFSINNCSNFKKIENGKLNICDGNIGINSFYIDKNDTLYWTPQYLPNTSKTEKYQIKYTKEYVGVTVFAEACSALLKCKKGNINDKYNASKDLIKKIFYNNSKEPIIEHILDFKRIMDFGQVAFAQYYNIKTPDNVIVLITHDELLVNIALLCGIIVVKTRVISNKETIKIIDSTKCYSHLRYIEVLYPRVSNYNKNIQVPKYKIGEIIKNPIEQHVDARNKRIEARNNKVIEEERKQFYKEVYKQELQLIKGAFENKNSNIITNIKNIIDKTSSYILKYNNMIHKTIINYLSSWALNISKNQEIKLSKLDYDNTFEKVMVDYITQYRNYLENLENKKNGIVKQIENIITNKDYTLEQMQKEYENVTIINSIAKDYYNADDIMKEIESIKILLDKNKDNKLIQEAFIDNEDGNKARNKLIDLLIFLDTFNISNIVEEYYNNYNKITNIRKGNIITRNLINTKTDLIKRQKMIIRRIRNITNEINRITRINRKRKGEILNQSSVKRGGNSNLNNIGEASMYLLDHYINKQYERLSYKEENNELSKDELIEYLIINLYKLIGEAYILLEDVDFNLYSMIELKIEMEENIDRLSKIIDINNIPKEIKQDYIDINNIIENIIKTINEIYNKNNMLSHQSNRLQSIPVLGGSDNKSKISNNKRKEKQKNKKPE